ncbi:MAG: hypothetical protein JXO51_06915 [Candidatus Aminicenantes bacterium]|nr:hypothetical protein [Candidatus Aminicenantes bacterium]
MKKIVVVVFLVLAVVLPVAAQGITVTSPNGGERWDLGSPQQITWSHSGISGNVRINLIKAGGGTAGTIATVPVADGRYSWEAGRLAAGSAPAGEYRIGLYVSSAGVDDRSDAPFTITEAKTPVALRPRPEPLAPLRLKFPRLEVSQIDLTPNAEGFAIVFNYKNVGDGSLPKASEVKEKPKYRVLVDGRETASGSLFIPAFAAPPGWEQKGYFGGWIVLPGLFQAEENEWHIGQTVTVHINENKAMGMESHALSLPLKPIALKTKCDALINGVSFDWQTRELTVSLRYAGQLQPLRQVNVTCSDNDEYWVDPKRDYSFFERVALKEGQGHYTIRKKISFPAHIHAMTLFVKVFVALAAPSAAVKAVDMDYRNNFWKRCRFTYPDSNPVR